MTKVWRVYNNGSFKNETYALSLYNSLDEWSDYNKEWRWGCAQIAQHDGEDPVILFEGYLNEERLQPFLEQIKTGEIG